MALREIRELGRFVERSTGGDPSLLLDPATHPSEFPSLRNRPELYDVWRVTLEEVTNGRGKRTGYVVNIRRWTRGKPSDSYPNGYENACSDNNRGGCTLRIATANALSDGLGAAVRDAFAWTEAQADSDPQSELDRLRAENAALRAAAAGGGA